MPKSLNGNELWWETAVSEASTASSEDKESG